MFMEAHRVPCTALGSGETRENKAHRNPCPQEVAILRGRQTVQIHKICELVTRANEKVCWVEGGLFQTSGQI